MGGEWEVRGIWEEEERAGCVQGLCRVCALREKVWMMRDEGVKRECGEPRRREKRQA